MQILENLGEFYLGQQADPETRQKTAAPYLYTSSDLTTHAVIVGMTGSGKTGLGIDLLEEALIDNIPALVIDPKGDMANLLLHWESPTGADLAPWVAPQAAEQAGLSVEEYAAQEAARWKKGQEEAGITGERIAGYAAIEKAVYTPGSLAGRPLSILNFAARPSDAILQDPEALSEYVASTVAGLLSLVNLDADPLTSRPFLLLTNVLQARWSRGDSLDLPGLIAAIQEPGIDRVGVMPLESFYPKDERFQLAMRFNNLLASPQFAAWLEGEPMDLDHLLYTSQGKARLAVVQISHLNDQERMFVVTLLLNQVVAWMRRQPGQTALRALLYMDEVHGFFPPVANPPSKEPMLTLLKQARAFGLGVVLSTQNPSDLDYKGLSNIGTWFIGHLQTPQDRARLLDGLDTEGLVGAEGRAAVDDLLAALPGRMFYAHNVHEDAPLLFSTRWTMSYLAGPVTGQALKRLQPAASPVGAGSGAGAKGAAASPDAQSAAAPAQNAALGAAGRQGTAAAGAAAASASPAKGFAGQAESDPLPPTPPEDMAVYFAPADGAAHYVPYLYGTAEVFYEDAKANVGVQEELGFLAEIPEAPRPADWEGAVRVTPAEFRLLDSASKGATFAAASFEAVTKTRRSAWEKSLKDYIYATERLRLGYDALTKTYGQPEESAQAFAVRADGARRSLRDEAVAKIKDKYNKKIKAMEEKIRKADLAVDREESQANAAKQGTLVSLGAAVLGGLLGKKLFSSTNLSRIGASARSLSRQRAQADDRARAEETAETYREDLKDLEAELEQELAAVAEEYSEASHPLETIEIKPKKTNIQARPLLLVWVPEGMEF